MPTRLFTQPICVFTLLFTLACNNGNNTQLTQSANAALQNSVSVMMADIAKDVAANGPTAWLRHFENTPTFFMADNGQLVLPNNDSAAAFINNKLVKVISNISLRWNDIRVDPLTPTMASIAAGYHEEITGFTAKTTLYDGYFTAIAEQTPQGWKLRNLHWSALTKQ